MISRRTVGWAILVYTLASWGGRIGLLTDADSDDVWSWVRIGGSLLIGVLTFLAFSSNRWVRPTAFLFAVFTTVIWVRSLVTVWTEPANSLGFGLIHTVLAVLWFALAVFAVRIGQDTEAGAGEPTTGVPGGTIADNADTTSSMDR